MHSGTLSAMLSRELQSQVMAEVARENLDRRSSNPQQYIRQDRLSYDGGLWRPKNRIITRLARNPQDVMPIFLGDTVLRVGLESSFRRLKGIHIAVLTTLLTDFDALDKARLVELGLFIELEMSIRSGEHMARITKAAGELAAMSPTVPEDFIQIYKPNNKSPTFKLNSLVVPIALVEKPSEGPLEPSPEPERQGPTLHQQVVEAILEQRKQPANGSFAAELATFSVRNDTYSSIGEYRMALEAFLVAKILPTTEDAPDETQQTWDYVAIDPQLEGALRAMRQVLQETASETPSPRWLYMQQVCTLASKLQAIQPSKYGAM